jgi:tetratricopeptide (TPR) repeat protein
MGDLDGAVTELRAAIRAKPDYAEAFYTLGSVLKQKGDLPAAADSLREAIRLQPDFAGAHTTLAGVLRQLGDPAGAATESKLGAEMTKQKVSEQAALFALNSGRRLLKVGDIEGAVSQFQSAIASSPNYALAHFELAQALKQQGKREEAEREFQRANELDPRLIRPAEK